MALEGSLTAKFTTNAIKLQTDSVDSFHTIQRKIPQLNSNVHSFSLKEERTLKVLLRGIPNFFSEEAVKEKLNLLEFEPKYIRQFKKKGRRLLMYMVTLPSNKENKDIFQLQFIFYVSIKKWKLTRLQAQLNVSHAKILTTLQPTVDRPGRCVIYGENHLTKECQKITVVTAKMLQLWRPIHSKFPQMLLIHDSNGSYSRNSRSTTNHEICTPQNSTQELPKTNPSYSEVNKTLSNKSQK